MPSHAIFVSNFGADAFYGSPGRSTEGDQPSPVHVDDDDVRREFGGPPVIYSLSERVLTFLFKREVFG